MRAREGKGEVERDVQASRDRVERFGSTSNVKKTEYLTKNVKDSNSVKISGIELARTSVFKHLGSPVASDHCLTFELVRECGFDQLTPGDCSFYDRNIPERTKSKIYRVVRPAEYGAESWFATNEVETCLIVLEMEMLRRTTEVTPLDRNEARSCDGMATL